MSARFAALRVRVADGPTQRIHDMGNQHMPGDQAWGDTNVACQTTATDPVTLTLSSGTALTVLLSLLVLGGPILRPAAFTLFVGIITGTYSSIYIASFLVLLMHKGQRPKMGSQVTVSAGAGVSEARTAPTRA